MAFYKKFLELGCKFFHAVGTIALAGIVVAVSCGVFARKVVGSPLTWPEELCTLLFICLAFSGACVSTYRKKHIIVDFLCQKFPKTSMRLITILMNVLIIIFMCLVCVGSFFLLPQVHMVLTVVLDIPRSVFFFPLLLASLYIVLFYIYDTIMVLTGKSEAVQPEGEIHS